MGSEASSKHIRHRETDMRINRAIERLAEDQPVFYTGAHSGHVLTREQGGVDVGTWADYVNVGMEHGAFDMAGLEAYLEGMVEAGPSPSGHRTPAVLVEAPVDGGSEEGVRHNAWQFRQILARGAHGVVLCQVETEEAVRAFVEACRYPINRSGVGRGLGEGTRGVGSESTAAAVWGVEREDYIQKADPWPLNPNGELLLGVKIETTQALERIDAILAVPGIGFAEIGAGDMSMSMGHLRVPNPHTAELADAFEKLKSACRAHGIRPLSSATLENVQEKIDEGYRVIAGGNSEIAARGRAQTGGQGAL